MKGKGKGPKGKAKGPPPKKELHISTKSYKHKDKNEEGFKGFAKNGLFYNFPVCCLFWICPKNEPKTEVRCRVK